MNERITALEEMVAQLSRTVDELSDVIARQDKELRAMNRRVGMLMEREATREAEGANSVPLADQVPPHW